MTFEPGSIESASWKQDSCTSRIKTGERIAGIGAVVLFISMFLDWFVVEIPDSSGVNFFLDGAGQSAWDTLDIIPFVLTVAIVTTLIVVFCRITGLMFWPLASADIIVLILGLVSVVMILIRIIEPPSFGFVPGHVRNRFS